MHGADAQCRFHCKEKRIFYRKKRWKKTGDECVEAWGYFDPVMMSIYRCIERRFSPLQQDLVCANIQPRHVIAVVVCSEIHLAKGLKLLKKKEKIIPNNE